MKTKLTLKERLAISIFSFFAMSALFVYFSDLFMGEGLNLFNILNPFIWARSYLKYPILFAVVLISNLLILITTSHQSHDHVLEGEDDARLASEAEILESFQSMQIKK